MRDSVEITGPEGARIRATIIPDGYFCLHDGKYVYHNFLEVDMGTETAKSSKFGRRDFSRKILGYLAYYNSGLYQRKYGPEQQDEELPMRVLTVTTSPKRMTSLKAVAEAAGAGKQFWFTTFDRLDSETVLHEPIWEVAGREKLHSLIW